LALRNTTAVASAKSKVHPKEEEISPEILAAIGAAVSAFLGTRFLIESAELVSSPKVAVNRWTRQGRATVLSSHNLRSKR
jgi:hypothetical protein